MKTMMMVMASLMLLAACDTQAPAQSGGCAECEKMAAEAKAAHDAKMAKEHGKDCECCKKHAH